MYVTFTSRAPGMTVRALKGEGVVKIASGFGGWELVPRPRRQAATLWTGIEPLRMQIPIVLDGFRDNDSVEPMIAKLEAMGRPPARGAEPPLVSVSGPAIPHDDLDWVIENLEQGTGVLSRSGRERVRQEMTVSLLRYVADDRLSVRSAQERALANAVATGNLYSDNQRSVGLHTVSEGETLASIAATEFGSAGAWHTLADLNDIRDPDSVVAGQVIRLQ